VDLGCKRTSMIEMNYCIEAYQQGLDGKAAAWAIKQQKTHCSTSERAMVALKSVAT
jgi:hypothetical protein